jgi:predicted MFS family arabinose efflux permease
VLQNRILLALAVASASFSFLGGFIGATYYLYAISELQLAPTLLGITISGGGIGALLGAALAGRITQRAGLGPALIGGLFVHGLMVLVIPLARGPAVMATGILFTGQLIGDAALMLYFVNDISLRQSVTPDRLLGRVNASMQFVVAAVGPLGLLLGGFLGQAIGLRPTLLLGALGSLLGSAWLLLSPVRGLRVFPTTDEHSSTPILDDSSHFEDNP